MNVLPWIMLVSLSANPCTNGSFEELDAGGFPADWGPVGQQASISSDAHAGKWALRLVRQRGTEGETGLNRVRLIDRLRGGIDFWYKAVSASDANLRVYVIPIDAAGVERTASSRATFTVPAGHIGDGQWRHARLAYDFTKNPAVKMVHFAARIEGAAGQLLLDDFSYVEHVGPVLRFGTVRLEEDPQQPGRRCRVHVPIYNDGDAAAQDVPFTLQLPTGLTASPAEVRLRDLRVKGVQRPQWIVEGNRITPGRITIAAQAGTERSTTVLKLAPQLVIASLRSVPVVPTEGQPLTMECMLLNRGNVTVDRPSRTFSFLSPYAPEADKRKTEIEGESIPPGRATILRGTLPPLLDAPDPCVRVTAKDSEERSIRAVRVVQTPNFPLPEPSGSLRAVAAPKYALLENEILRLAFRKHPFGFHTGQISARTAEGWKTIAWIPEMGRVASFENSRDVVSLSVCPEDPPLAENQPGSPARLRFSWGPWWDLKIIPCRAVMTFELEPGGKSVFVRYEFSAERPMRLGFADGPWILAEHREEAVFPGLEWLVGDELSSDSLDIAKEHPDRNRTIVHPNYVTIPAIGIQAKNGTVGLLWNPRQKWDGRRDRPTAIFGSPMPHFGIEPSTHTMGLFLPSFPEFVENSSSIVKKPYPLEPGKPIRLECRIFVDGRATDALAAIDEWIRVYGLPQPTPIPHGSYEKEIEFSMQAYLKSLWVPEEKTWWTTKGAGPVMSNKDRPRAFVADLLLGELLCPSPEVRKACRARAEEVLKVIGGEARLDAQRFPGPVDRGLADPISAASLLAQRGEDGAWRFDANQQAGPPFEGMDYYELGRDKAVEVGVCARKAYEILRYVRIAGDWQTYRRMEPTLALMESFRVPRAAQVWEVPVHTPDILAAADAVDAYLEAYRFSGDPRWLRDAVTWARRGLPFVYLWSDPQKPFLLGATIPVFGASWFQGSWFGRPVQWNGLRYAYAIQKLAEHDRSKPWRQIAEMIVRSAMYQQDVAGENVALWPDNISAVDSQKCPWVFSPREIIHCVLKLIGRDEEPQTTILGQGERRLHVTATAKIDRATWDGRTCSFRATYPAGEQGVILVANVVRPAAVYLDGRSLTERPDVEKGPEPGWRYDMGSGYLSIRVHHDGPALVRIDGAAFRHVERLPRLVERIAFEFDGSTEGWLALNDLGPLESRDGNLAGSITGPDPYLARSMLRIRGDACPAVVVRMRVTAGELGQFYWGTESSPGFSEERVVNFPIQADGQFHEYRLDLSRHPRWSGQTITALRLDPGNGARAGEFAVDYIRGVEAPPAKAPPKICVDRTHHGFVDAAGKRFVPFGVTYYRPGTGWAPQLWKQFDAEATRRDFARLKKQGANVVRVFISFGSFFTEPGKLNPEGLAKFDQLLDLADEAGLYVHPTGPDAWEGMPAWTKDLNVFSNDTNEPCLKALENYWRLFAARYRGRRTIWAYDLRNEPHLAWDAPYLRLQWAAWRTAHNEAPAPVPNPKSNRPSPELADYQRFRESIGEKWVAQQARAIHAADPNALVTVGLLQWSVPAQRINIDQYTAFRPSVIAKHLDFLELHFYPLVEGAYDYGSPAAEIANLAVLEAMARECAKPGLPLVIAEFGWYGGGPLNPKGKPATEEQQAQWCRHLLEVTSPIACGWLNWGMYDNPQATDVSKFTGLFTVDGKEKAWGRTFRDLAQRFQANPPAHALPNRPDLPWAACTASGDEMEKFRRAYLAAFAAEWKAHLSSEHGGLAQFGFDLHEAVVLGDPLAAAGRAGLDLAAAHCHGEVGQEGVFRLARAVRHHVAPAGLLAHLNSFDRLGDSADLIELDEHGVGALLLDASGDELRVGHIDVVADDLDFVAQGGRVFAESVPVVLRQAILDGDNGVLFHPRLIQGRHLGTGLLALARLRQIVGSVFVE